MVNAQPAGGVSASLTLTPYQVLAISPKAIISVPATGLLYAAISATASSNPNTVIPIDPDTGAMKTPISVGKGPSLLAVSSDGSYLYVANQTDMTVQRINLQTNTVERTFPYTPNLYCSSCTNLAATDLTPVPGSPQQVVLSQGELLTLYNDTGAVNHVPNDGICCYADPEFDSVAIAGDPLIIYGLPFLIDGSFFQTASLSSSGLTYTRPTEVNHGGDTTTGAQVISDGTLLYTGAGQIWDPSTKTKVGTFPVTTINAGSFPDTHNISLDTSLSEFYTIGEQIAADESGVVFTAYNLKSHAIDATLPFSQIQGPIERYLIRWGENGIGFLADTPDFTDQQIYLLKTAAVSATASNPMPVLNAISPASAVQGAGAFTLTVTGSGFLGSSVIDWNGTPLTTSFVSAQQLTAILPASDIATAGTGEVSVYTPGPGGGSSASTALAVIAMAPVVSLSSSSLSFGNVAQTLSSSAQTIHLTNIGNATLSISGIAITGNFSTINTCGSNLAAGASCDISVVFTPATIGALTGSLTITDNASNSPSGVALTGIGVAALTIAPQQGGSPSVTANSGGTATYNLAISGAPGLAGTVSLSCTGAPQYATCSITPATVSLQVGSATNFVVTVSTTQTVSAQVAGRSTIYLGLCLAPLFGVSLFVRKRRYASELHCLLAMTFVLAFGTAGCSGGSSGNGGGTLTNRTPAGTYTLVVNASTGSVTATQDITLVVN